mmetsp:Transcript_3860/g.13300  ORF Transcript_3860/g.13300 Transcript_3860/m.13300 type:complete len:209 (+) Transcript_3860:309-935(+)
MPTTGSATPWPALGTSTTMASRTWPLGRHTMTKMTPTPGPCGYSSSARRAQRYNTRRSSNRADCQSMPKTFSGTALWLWGTSTEMGSWTWPREQSATTRTAPTLGPCTCYASPPRAALNPTSGSAPPWEAVHCWRPTKAGVVRSGTSGTWTATEFWILPWGCSRGKGLRCTCSCSSSTPPVRCGHSSRSARTRVDAQSWRKGASSAVP